MSQPRVLLAVCALGAVVGLVAAQIDFDADGCQTAIRKEFDNYSARLNAAAQKFGDSLQSNTDGASDTSAFQADIDKLTNSFNQLANQNGDFDAAGLSTLYVDNMQTLSSLMRTAFTMYMSMPQGAMGSYVEFGQSLMEAQNKLMTAVATSCAPSSRLRPRP